MNHTITPDIHNYSTREQLYALCVLICWKWGLTLSRTIEDENTVTLMSCPKGNTGLSAYLLETNPNVTNFALRDAPSLPDSEIYFSVLGIPLVVTFDGDGVGTVMFAGAGEGVGEGLSFSF